MRIRPRTFILPVLVAAGLAVAALFALRKSATVDMARVRKGPIREVVEEEGKTRVIDRYVLSAPVAGRLFRVAVEEGDPVRKGQVLAEIDPLPLQNRVDEAQAKIRELRSRLAGVDRRRPDPDDLARAGLLVRRAEEALAVAGREVEEAAAAADKAHRDAERARKLQTTGTLSLSEREAAELAGKTAAEDLAAKRLGLRIRRIELETAKVEKRILENSGTDLDWEEDLYRAQLDAVASDLAVFRDDLTRAKIVAPVNGTVLERFRESETPVTAGIPILSVGDVSRLEATADMLSGDAARMRPGMKVELFGPSLDTRVVPGSISRIYPSAFTKISSLGVEQQRVKIVVSFDSAGTGLGDRYRVDVRVILAEKKDVLLVPEGALFRHEGDWHVFRVEGLRARLTRVRIGVGDGRDREVIEGLSAGDRVILHPNGEIENGTRVTPAGE